MSPGLTDERTFVLAKGTVTIGRTSDNAVHCLHKSLSRKHAQLDFDGRRVTVTDLESKNGVFFNGKRIERCELVEGDSFRCGDVTFVLEGGTARSPLLSMQERTAQTLPSPHALVTSVSPGIVAHPGPNISVEEEQRFKDKLFLLIRATGLCVSEVSIDHLLEELVGLAVQVLEADRMLLLTLDDTTLEMKPRAVRSFVGSQREPYSRRVVDWVVDHGSPASFLDVSQDRTLPGDPTKDLEVRGAMCAPINPGGGTIGVFYADSLARVDCFGPDDLALLRALANLAAVSIESAALRSNGQPSARLPAR